MENGEWERDMGNREWGMGMGMGEEYGGWGDGKWGGGEMGRWGNREAGRRGGGEAGRRGGGEAGRRGDRDWEMGNGRREGHNCDERTKKPQREIET